MLEFLLHFSYVFFPTIFLLPGGFALPFAPVKTIEKVGLGVACFAVYSMFCWMFLVWPFQKGFSFEETAYFFGFLSANLIVIYGFYWLRPDLLSINTDTEKAGSLKQAQDSGNNEKDNVTPYSYHSTVPHEELTKNHIMDDIKLRSSCISNFVQTAQKEYSTQVESESSDNISQERYDEISSNYFKTAAISSEYQVYRRNFNESDRSFDALIKYNGLLLEIIKSHKLTDTLLLNIEGMRNINDKASIVIDKYSSALKSSDQSEDAWKQSNKDMLAILSREKR